MQNAQGRQIPKVRNVIREPRILQPIYCNSPPSKYEFMSTSPFELKYFLIVSHFKTECKSALREDFQSVVNERRVRGIITIEVRIDIHCKMLRQREIRRIQMKNERVYKMKFSKVYPLLVQKAEKKGRTKEEVDTVIRWLTGYDEAGLRSRLEKEVDYETFFAEAPELNPNVDKIKGVVCGIRVENIEDPLMQKVRWLDKLVDELAQGKALEKILRS